MTKGNPQLNGEIRTLTGRKVNQLRRNGMLPSTVYGRDFEPKTIQFNCKEFSTVYDEVGESGLIDLMLDGKKIPILLRNTQFDAVSGNIMHVDCYKVNLKEKITTSVPIEIVGEAPAVKMGNILVQVSTELEIEALPTDLPEKIEVDISGLETVDQMITVADIKTGKEIEIKTAEDQVIVKLEEPKEEEEQVEEVAPEEVPATEQKAPEESEAEAK